MNACANFERPARVGRTKDIVQPFLSCSRFRATVHRMSEVTDGLTPATPGDLADALAFALRFDGRRRKHDAAEMMARIVAKRLVEHLERSGFVVLKKPPIGGSAPPYRGEVAP